MITFTKEQLIASAQARIEFAEMMLAGELEPLKERTWSIELELASIALASLEAEPVAWLLSGGGAKNHVSFDSGNAYADPLREVTPLYTAPPAPVALPSGYSDFEEIWSSSTHPLTQDDEMKDFAWDIWNACRAAMLQGADGNAPAHFRSRPAQSSLSPAQGGNSPVIPDGWMMVPVEPTPDMREAYHQAQAEYEDSDGLWSPDHQWQAMLAAAPQQEVKP